MSMEMNRLWNAADFKALAKRLCFAAGAAKEPQPNEEMEKQMAFLAHACRLYLDNYENNQK
mgnify:CR=1 FL=1